MLHSKAIKHVTGVKTTYNGLIKKIVKPFVWILKFYLIKAHANFKSVNHRFVQLIAAGFPSLFLKLVLYLTKVLSLKNGEYEWEMSELLKIQNSLYTLSFWRGG